MKAIPVTILHGFLGSGKTTVLRSLLSSAKQADCLPSVIVNDMSELDVDGVLITNTDIVSGENGNFVTISGESVSSPEGIKKVDAALKQFIEKQPPWVVIETSGSSHPLPLIEYFKQQRQFALKSVITLVDAKWLQADYTNGAELIPKWQENLQHDRRGIENLLVEQILFSNRVFLTKTDKLNAETVQLLAHALHPINPYADIVSTSWGNVALEQFTQKDTYNFFLVEQLITELREHVDKPLTLSGKSGQKIVAEVISDDRPFHPMRLWQTCHNFLTEGVFRSKGFFWMPSRDDMSLLWSQANGSVGLEVVGFWRAAIINDESQRFTPEQQAILQTKIDNVQSRFGDRRCRLTVIGQQDEASQFVEALKRCFLTDKEIEAWQNGEVFEDPWPSNVAKL